MPAREEVLTKKMEEYVKESAFANAGNRTALSLHTSKQHIFTTTEIPSTSYLWNIRRKILAGTANVSLE